MKTVNVVTTSMLKQLSCLIVATCLCFLVATEATAQPKGQPFQDLQMQIDALTRRVGELGDGMRQAIQVLEQRVAGLETFKTQAEAKIASLEAYQTQAEATIASLETFKTQAEAKMASLETYQTQAEGRIASLETQLNDLSKLGALLALTDYVKVVPGTVNGLSGPHIMFEGVNLHLRSGSGSTSDGGSSNGLGNLIIGYNEAREQITTQHLESIVGILGQPHLNLVRDPYDFANDPFPGGARPGFDSLMSRRDGSHNLIVGDYHNYNSYGAIIGGMLNATDEHAVGASVLGGMSNVVTHPLSSIVGGASNVASANYSSILGGRYNRAYSHHISAKARPPAPIDPFGSSASSVSIVGGLKNQATEMDTVIVGGTWNSTMMANSAVIVGGYGNYINGHGEEAVILGGRQQTVTKSKQVQPLDAYIEAVAAIQSGGACSDETKWYFDLLSSTPTPISWVFGWLSAGCDVW